MAAEEALADKAFESLGDTTAELIAEGVCCSNAAAGAVVATAGSGDVAAQSDVGRLSSSEETAAGLGDEERNMAAGLVSEVVN